MEGKCLGIATCQNLKRKQIVIFVVLLTGKPKGNIMLSIIVQNEVKVECMCTQSTRTASWVSTSGLQAS